MRLVIYVFYIYIAFGTANITINLHKSKRAQLLQDEAVLIVGGNTQLSDKETIVNNCLMEHKFQEVDYAFDNPECFNFSRHFFKYKDEIKNSKVYRIIKDMPKGAALHVHDMALMNPDYLLQITYMEHLYVCFTEETIDLLFSNAIPNKSCSGNWTLMKDARAAAGNTSNFDSNIRKHFTMVVDDPDRTYPTIKESWTTFLKYFQTVAPMLSYRPVWEQYFYDALKRFREDNVMHVEVRSVLPQLYELDGTTYDQVVTAKAYRKMAKKFMKDFPDFIGVKLIYAPPRSCNRLKLGEYLETAKSLKENVPEIFAGFDLVGAEDRGNPLIDFLPQLQAASKDLNFFFHAGETDWWGTLTDDNLVDAILLGAKRLGHAYALPKHPLLTEEVRKRDIGLEVNVISNAVLSLVRDVRNHPLAIFLANGLPVVLSSDDPGVWEADPISHDYYVSFVGVASRLSDLRLLKALAINSLKYSAISETEKGRALKSFDIRWQQFIDKFKCEHY